jgi:peptidoglycan/xylan/chitin deacetylase (PgdA/CDA1 family)
MSRRWIAKELERAGLLSLALRVRKRTPSPWLPVLTYHRFASGDATGGLGGVRHATGLLDDGVGDTTPETFDRHLSLLERWFTILDLEDLFGLRSGKFLPPNPVLVTFDDGYKDGLEVALPILRRHGVRATFFVATDYIEQRRLFWWDRIHLIVKSSQRESIELSYPSRRRFHLRTPGERSTAAARLVRLVKDESELDLEKFLDEVSEACCASLGPDEEGRIAEDLLMTWDDLRALRDAGMSVQSHTRSHRTLQTVPTARLYDELGGSREVLERELGERVRAVAYPVGKRLGSAPQIRAAVRAAGYELGFSNDSGVNNVWTFDPLDTRRLALDIDLPEAHFLAMLAVPWLAY